MRRTMRAVVVAASLVGFGLTGAAAAQADGANWYDSFDHTSRGVDGTSIVTPTLSLQDVQAGESSTSHREGFRLWR